MNRLDACFAALRARSEKALVAFVTAGDPLPDNTADVVCALAGAGADVIEIGVPFSDPLADGPTIQASSFRALQAGMTPPKVLEIVRDVRARGVETPLILMGAWNPILQYGPERFALDAVLAGVDGAIVTDMIPEESGEWKPIADAAGLATVFLLAPTSDAERIDAVTAQASGFIYCMSISGITGTREAVATDLTGLLGAIRAKSGGVPICVGFGIKRPEQVRALYDVADGAVVGSALVQLLHENRDSPELLTTAVGYITALKAATKPQ